MKEKVHVALWSAAQEVGTCQLSPMVDFFFLISSHDICMGLVFACPRFLIGLLGVAGFKLFCIILVFWIST